MMIMMRVTMDDSDFNDDDNISDDIDTWSVMVVVGCYHGDCHDNKYGNDNN